MSVFSDFQKAWVQRFPGCELPQAWEEDVRANLSKHRQKVALLREELEKEEFYVEYLERLLADVERVKRSNVTKPIIDNIKEENGGRKDENKNIEEVSSSAKYSSQSLEQNLHSENLNTNINFLAQALNTSCLNDQIYNTEQNHKASHAISKDHDSYVTVIEVSGEPIVHKNNVASTYSPCDHEASHLESNHTVALASKEKQTTFISYKEFAKNETSSSTLTDDTSINILPSQPMGEVEKPAVTLAPPLKKKPPPLPPPKKIKKIPSFTDNSNQCDVVSPSNPTNSNVKHTFSTFKPLSSVMSSESPKETVTELNYVLESRTSLSESTVPLTNSNHLPKVQEFEMADSQSKAANFVPKDDNHDLKMEDNEQQKVIEDEKSNISQNKEIDSPKEALAKGPPLNNKVNSIDDMEVLEPELDISKSCINRSISKESLLLDSLHECVPTDSPDSSTYMNIDYFLKKRKEKLSTASIDGSYALDSDEDDSLLPCSLQSDIEGEPDKRKSQPSIKDDVFELGSGSSLDSSQFTSLSDQKQAKQEPLPTENVPPTPELANDSEPKEEESAELPLESSEELQLQQKAEAERLTMYKCIISSILESETIYVECLSILLQYMKALRSTIDTSQPLLSKEDFNVIFFKIPDLHAVHETFLESLRKKTENWDSKTVIGDHFKILASRLGVYAAFLQNYSRAIETVRRCSTSNAKFQEITKTIKLKSLQGQATNLEDLLHKPVARVQKNALVLHDLIRYTPSSHPDFRTLKVALKMTQCFLNDLNLAAAESMFPAMDKAQRHLVKNSFIVELYEGHRKLRHLFLFNDVIVCAKCKPSNRQKFAFEIKWYIPLSQAVLPTEESEVKEVSPQDVLSLKSRACTFRDHILKEENQKAKGGGARNLDKHRKKLAELEGQLVLASPTLPFRVGTKNKMYTFFLSSEFERSQWIEAISVLQVSAPTSTTPLSPYELQAWITSCRKHLGNSLGSFLLRTGKDEELLVGDLYITVYSLHGLTRPADVFLCFEVDSYGHFFNKAKTRVSRNTTEAQFNQDFVVELEGSQSLRILMYECTNQSDILRGKAALELTGGWLSDRMHEKSVALQEFMVTLGLKFLPSLEAGPKIPSSKSVGLFGMKIQQVCKKEKSSVPFLVRLCVGEVERRGMAEVGIYRVSGSAADVLKLKKAFETNAYTGERLLKEVDIHTVTGLLKLYLRELPEALFTDLLYPRFLQAFNLNNGEEKAKQLIHLFDNLPQVNQQVINYLLDHMLKVNELERQNKMSLHNLATVLGPNMLRPPTGPAAPPSDPLTAGTVDVMAQAGILYFFLLRRKQHN